MLSTLVVLDLKLALRLVLNRIVNFFGILAYSFLVALILIPHTGHIEGQKDIDRQKDIDGQKDTRWTDGHIVGQMDT